MIALDDNIEDHPKFVGLSNDAFALWVRCVGYCRRNLTDGFVPDAAALARARSKAPKRAIDELLRVAPGCANALWTRVPGGYQIHDYLEWNPSRQVVEAKIEANREKGRKGGLKSGLVRAKTEPSASPALEAEANDERSKIEAASFAPASTKTNPDPIRSDPIRSECESARTLERLPTGHLTADAIAAELAAHHRLAQLATDPEFPSTLLSRAMGKGTKAEWLADAIADAAADTPAGEQAHATMKRVRAYCDRARPPRHNDAEPGSSPPKATSDAERMVPIETSDGLRLRDDDPRIELDGASGLRGWDWEKHGKPPAKLPVGVRHWNAPGPKPSLLGGAS